MESGSLYPVFVEFASTNTQENSRLAEIYSEIAAEIRNIMQPNFTIEEAKNTLAGSNNYQNLRDVLLQSFYWRADEYVIVLTITYNDTKTQQYRFKFNIDANEAAAFKEILKSLSSAEWMKFTESLRICSAHRKNSLSMMANKTPALNRSTHSALNIMEHV